MNTDTHAARNRAATLVVPLADFRESNYGKARVRPGVGDGLKGPYVKYNPSTGDVLGEGAYAELIDRLPEQEAA